MCINLGIFSFETYDSTSSSHRWLLEQFKGDSSSNFIAMIDSRLKMNHHQKSFPFNTGFVVSLLSGELVGYVFISSIHTDEVYLEYSILKEKRRQGYGSSLLSTVTDYLFQNYNIRDISLDIDVSNEASINTALCCGYYQDECLNGKKMIYKNYNLNYVDKRNKKR